MKSQFLVFVLALAVFLVTGCETHQQGQPRPAAKRQDFFETGRGLSGGTVDLYQPGTDFLPTSEFPAAGRPSTISSIPGNTNIMVNDPNVTIYSLDTEQISEPQPAPLPPLQPPTKLQGSYPSPFNKNGNFTE